MKFVFIVQGEGRGHMTQALAMRHLLVEAGHEIVAVCIGSSKRREVPSFFLEKIGAPVTRFLSPNFVTNERNRGILIGASIWQNLLKADQFLTSLSKIEDVVQSSRPDLVINFYEPLWGLYQTRHPRAVSSVCVAHQFLARHQDFPFPEGHATDKAMLQALNSITAKGSMKRLCLSFTPMAEPENPKLVVVPPLLRPRLFDLTPTDGDYLLVYTMQAGYGEDIVAWHAAHPDVELHCFWDRRGAPVVEQLEPNLTFHQLADVKFLEMMAGCRGLVTTAGFESVCEAMYLGKPVFMTPVEGHFEQTTNALDAARAGAGIWSNRFDLDAFMDYLPKHKTDSLIFRAWADGAAELIIKELETAGAS